jgi:hypothetical protein
MKKFIIIALVIFSSAIIVAQSVVVEKNGIKLTSVKDSPLFKDAALVQLEPTFGTKLDTLGVKFSYSVKNYQLTSQTNDAPNKHCSNSAKGQHIHLILNNEPYLAKYETSFTEKLKPGNYVALSFLSRSYHESLKHKKAYQLTQFTVGPKMEGSYVDLKTPMLFYSRPKGEYVGEDAKKVLLDFYLVNSSLSEKGYRIKATINGIEFILTEWITYAMEGLPIGENKIELELIDKNGKFVDGPFNKVSRIITLK